MIELIDDLRRAGQATIFSAQLVEAETKRVADMEQVRSDDPHVLALARLSGARVLYSEDGDLMDDFKDRTIVPHPKGKVYRFPNKDHKAMLSGTCRC
jgi:hypothetical protein